MKASDYIRWTVNAMQKMKSSKYSFKNVTIDSPVFKGVNGKSFQSQHGSNSFNHVLFSQGLIENPKSWLIAYSEACLMKDIQAIIPEKWPSNNDVPWLEGESRITKICKRFHILSEDILPQFRKFFSDLKCVQTEFNERMIQGFL